MRPRLSPDGDLVTTTVEAMDGWWGADLCFSGMVKAED
jgi:hypothetical protein